MTDLARALSPRAASAYAKDRAEVEMRRPAWAQTRLVPIPRAAPGARDLELRTSFQGRRPEPPRDDQAAREAVGRPLQTLLSQGLVAPGVYYAAERRAEALGVGLDETLLAVGALGEEALYRALARKWRLPYEPAPKLDAMNEFGALTAGVATLEAERGAASFALAPRGARLEATARLLSRPGGERGGDLAIASPSALRAAALEALGPRLADAASRSVDPKWRAKGGATPTQAVVLILFALVVLAAALPVGALGDAAALALGLFFLLAMTVRLTAFHAAPEEREHAPPLSDRDLPRYAVVVAMYREEKIVADLVAALDALDYPREKLRVSLVVEEEDAATRAALARLALPPHMEVVVVHDGRPRTKPRALDAALFACDAELLVVYDAEDRPARDQLRRAAARFAQARRDLACLQARLAVDNEADGLLPALFALDYVGLFETINPGLGALGWPMLLGGTSNHFRVEALRAMGGWDAWNVTEDADLGLRLARAGYRVETLRSTTWEEAPITLRAWLAQRRRWLKGWMQTALVHSRDPGTAWRELGAEGALAAIGLLGGGIASALLMPIFTLRVVLDLWLGRILQGEGWLGLAAVSVTLTVLAAGPVSAVVPALRGLRVARRWRLARYAPLLPLFYMLVSWAAWRALVEMFHSPHSWAKTEHGVSRRRSAGTAS
jgi:hypothetical protein